MEYGYNSLGYLAQVRSVRGGPSAPTTVLDWTVQTQDAEHRVRQEQLGNGLVTRREFSDKTGRLQRIYGGVSAADASVQNDTYVYDALGDLDNRTQLVATGGALLTETFIYDSLNRLLTSQVSGQSVKASTYNELGNLTSRSGVGSLYTYPANGATSVRPHAVSSITGTVNGVTNPSFAYDANGNLMSGAARSFTWMSFNLPATVAMTKAGATTTSTFVYGPEQQRIRQTIAATSTTTIFYAGAIEKETTGSSTRIRTYLPRGIGFIEEKAAATASRYLHKDHLGSVVAVSTETGATLLRMSYDPWGKRRNADGTDDTGNTLTNPTDRRGYTGHEHLEAQALIHMNGRIYDPVIGRFTSADPTVPDPMNPQNLNRYSYVLNNPFVYTDPTGFSQSYAEFRTVFQTLGDFGGVPTFGTWTTERCSTGVGMCDVYRPDDSDSWGVADEEQRIDRGARADPDLPQKLTQKHGCKGTLEECQKLMQDSVDETGEVIKGVAVAGAVAAGTIIVENSAGGKAVGAFSKFKKWLRFGKQAKDAAPAAKALPDSALVCRGGLCTADRFAGGSGVKLDAAGKMSGASVNSAADKTLKDLSATIPNPKLGVTTVGDIRRAGGDVVPKSTTNNPYHCEMCGITPQQAERLFTPVVPNPSR